jgi:hypothetical protein
MVACIRSKTKTGMRIIDRDFKIQKCLSTLRNGASCRQPPICVATTFCCIFLSWSRYAARLAADRKCRKKFDLLR